MPDFNGTGAANEGRRRKKQHSRTNSRTEWRLGCSPAFPLLFYLTFSERTHSGQRAFAEGTQNMCVCVCLCARLQMGSSRPCLQCLWVFVKVYVFCIIDQYHNVGHHGRIRSICIIPSRIPSSFGSFAPPNFRHWCPSSRAP